MSDFPLGIDEGGTHPLNTTYPHPETGVSHIYRGNGKWQVFVNESTSEDGVLFYLKAEVDALVSANSVRIDDVEASVTSVGGTASTALVLGQAALPGTQKGMALGVAELDASGKVPNDQLPDAVVSGIPDWDDITNKPSVFAPDTHTHGIADVTNLQTTLDAKLDASGFTGVATLALLLSVDGAGSGLDADLLDGRHSADFSLAGHDHTGVYAPFTHTHSEYLEVDVNSLSTATNFEIGTYLFGAEPGTGVELNASVTLYLDDNDDTCGACVDVDYRRAVTTTATANTVLSGTWRFRGRAAGGGGLYQRVA